MTQSENPSHSSPTSSQPATDPVAPPPKRRKRRRWLKVLGVLVVLLVALVALAPTLLSTGPVRSLVVKQVNARLNGRVEIADWSLGWTGIRSINGVRLFDAGGRQILELRQLTTGFSPLKALRGNYDLGNVVIDGLDFHARREADGTLNFANLMKQETRPSRSKRGAGQARSPANSAPSKLPNVRGNIQVKDSRGTFEDVQKNQTVFLTSIGGEVKIPEINQPIENALQVVAKTASGQSGTIQIDGTVDVIDNNEVHTERASVHEKIHVAGVDLSGIAALLGPGGGIQQLTGITDATLTVQLDPRQGGAIEGQLAARGASASGPALKGDTLSLGDVSLVIPPTTVTKAPGQSDYHNARFRVGDGKQAITLTMRQGKVMLGMDATPQSLINLSKNQAPGADGAMALNTDLDLGDFARQLRNTMAVKKDVELQSGRFAETTTVAMSAEKARIDQTLDVTDIRGTQAGKPVELQPIHLTLGAEDRGGGKSIPDLRDLSLTLKSVFTNASFQGESLADLSGQASGDLAKLREELSQVIELGKVQLAGTFDLQTSSKRDLTGGGGSNPLVTATLTAQNLRMEGVAGLGPIAQQIVKLVATAEAIFDRNSLRQLKNGVVTAYTGDSDRPTVDAELHGNVNFASSSADKTGASTKPASAGADFNIQKLNVDLARAQRDFGGLVPSLKEKGLLFREGNLSVTGSGKYAASAANCDVKTTIANVSLDRSGAGERRAAVLSGYAATIEAGGDFTSGADESSITLNKFTLTDNQNMLLLKVTEGNFVLKTGEGKSARAADPLQMVQKLSLTADAPDLAKLQSLYKAFFPSKPETTARASERASEGLEQLVPILAVRDRPRQAVADNSPKPNAPTPPRTLTGGSATLSLSVSHEGQKIVIVPKLDARDVSFACGDVRHTLGAADFNSTISFVPAPPAASNVPEAQKPSLVQRIRELNVSQLVTHLAGSEVKLTAPLVMSDVGGLSDFFSSLTASGGNSRQAVTLNTALTADGDVGRLAALLEALDGAQPGSKYPYSGKYTTEQKVQADQNGFAAIGRADVNDFLVKGSDSQFAERRIHLANDVSIDPGKQVLSIKDVSLSMEQTKALGLKVVGNISDLNHARKIEQLTADLNYDLASLWQIIQPTLSPEAKQGWAKDVKVAGTAQKRFEFHGSYPADKPFAEAIRTLSGSGGFDVGSLDGSGLAIRDLSVPFKLENGNLRVVDPANPDQLPKPAVCNEGLLRVGGATLSLAEPHPRLSFPKETKLLENVKLNPLLASKMGDLINNPLYTNAEEASGVLNVTVVQCDRLPVDSRVKDYDPNNDGKGEFSMSLTSLHLGNKVIAQVLDLLGQNEFGRSLQGEIQNEQVIIQKGVVTHNLTFLVGEQKRPLRMWGNVRLQDRQMMGMVLDLTKELLGVARNKDFQQYLPEGIQIPLQGLATSPQVDIAGAVQQAVAHALPGNLLNRALGGDKGRGKDGATQPADSGNPLDRLLNGIGGGNDAKDKGRDGAKEKDRDKPKKDRKQKNRNAEDQTNPDAPR